ncbi:MAG: hypothetical protein IH845_04340 [Nanoarchaeota archaeon]|nr:hypothetical protein [Nanoarchaeota archaeon]
MKKIVVDFVAKVSGLSVEETSRILEVPQNETLGDFSLPCFEMAKAKYDKS